MKKSFIYILTALFTTLAVTSCEKEKNVDDAVLGLSIKVYSPTKVIPGQEVIISGTGLDAVTSVTFPGGVSVTDIAATGSGMIRVITPTGIDSKGGVLTVQSSDGTSATAPIPMTVGKPLWETVVPAEEVKTFERLEISGVDMEFYEKAIFPGKEEGTEIVVNAIDFVRKSTGLLWIKVPAGHAEGPARIRLVAVDGSVATLSELTLIEQKEPVDEEEVDNPWEGPWVWYHWGGGGYLISSESIWSPSTTGPDDLAPGEGSTDAWMLFGAETFTKYLSNGSKIEEIGYKVDMTKTKTGGWNNEFVWSIGELSTGSETVLVGVNTYPDPDVVVHTYDIVEISDNFMTLAHAPEGTAMNDNAMFWKFQRPSTTVSATADFDLRRKQVVAFADIPDFADYWVDPDFLSPVRDKNGVVAEGNTKFLFRAIDGKYKIVVNSSLKCVTVEVLNADGSRASSQPDGSGAVWVLGIGSGKPTYANEPGWNPGKGYCLAPIGGNKHRVTLIAGEQINAASINFKFFHMDQWGQGEFTNSTFTCASPLIQVGQGQDVNGSDPGNLTLSAGTTLTAGNTYEFTLDLSNGRDNGVLSVKEIAKEE